MSNQQKTSKTLNIALWVVQVILSLTFIWAASLKLFQPIPKLALMWPWVAQVPVALVKFTGLIDLVGVIGVLLPSLLRIKPILTPIAAICIVVLMVCASVFHIARGEASSIGVNIVFALMAAFIAWGRLKKAPILPK